MFLALIYSFSQAGLVLANDADYRRSQMLVHQTKRLQSPCFLVMNHDAAHFPNIHVRLSVYIFMSFCIVDINYSYLLIR